MNFSREFAFDSVRDLEEQSAWNQFKLKSALKVSRQPLSVNPGCRST